jgi:O-antigen/teichoic acid export membrane protein
LASALTVRRLLPRESRRLVRPDPALFRELVAYSLSTLLYAAGGVVLYQTMKFVASWRCGGIEAAGEMGLAIGLAQTLSVVFTPAVGVLQSRVGQLQGEGRLDQVAPLLERSLVALGLLLVPSLVFLVVDARVIFAAWVGATAAGAALDSLATTARLLFLGHGFYIAALPFYYVLLGVGAHRVFGLGMLAVALLNTGLGWLATGFVPRIEALGVVYGVLMLGLVVFVTAPAGLRRFPLPLGRVLRRGLAAPLLAAAPGALALTVRPRLGRPLVDLVIDAAIFALLCLPGLELARRRFALPLWGPLRG